MRNLNVVSAVMQTQFRRTATRLIPVVAAAVALAGVGCSTGTSTTTQSLVKSINCYIPPAGLDPSLTLFANTIYLTGGNIGFSTVANSGGYINLSSGTYNLAASGPSTTPIQLLAQSFAGNNTAYTVAAAGQGGQTGTYKPQLILMQNYTANQLTLPTGNVAVRIVNLSLNPNTIGVFSTVASVPTTAVAASTAAVAYGYTTAANAYVAIPTASLVNMALVDTTAPTTPIALSSTSNLNTLSFTAGDAYTLFIYGQPGNSAQPMGCTGVQDYPAP